MQLLKLDGKLGNRIIMSRQYSNVISVDNEVHYFSPNGLGGKQQRIIMKDDQSLFFADPINFSILFFCNIERDGDKIHTHHKVYNSTFDDIQGAFQITHKKVAFR